MVVYDELFKKVNTIQTIDTSNLVKKPDHKTRVKEFEDKIPDHDKYIITQEFNKLTTKNFPGRLKQAILASKNDTGHFLKKTYFAEKLINVNKKRVTLNRRKHRG